MSEDFGQFARFMPALLSRGSKSSFVLGSEEGFEVYYVPFEYVNPDARLMLVGITPGPEQMKCAYMTAHRLLSTGTEPPDLFRIVKQSCAFIGMRPRINEMLDHFGLPQCVGARSGSALWDESFSLLHTTSVVPNATFKNEKYFNGPFSDVLRVGILQDQFERVFIPSIRCISSRARYIGMGPVVDEALMLCVARGVLRSDQILGYFPHASGASGSQFGYFVRRKRLVDLKLGDPVRHRVRDLDAAYARMAANTKAFCEKGPSEG